MTGNLHDPPGGGSGSTAIGAAAVPAAALVPTALATLKDVPGIAGSFAFTNTGRLVGREIHPMFDSAVLSEAGERLTRLRETFAAVGDELDLAVIRYQDHKLYLKALPGGMLCIVATGVVNMAALRMAANLVGRRIAPALDHAAGEVPPPAEQPPAPVAAVAAASVPGTARRPPVVAPGTGMRRFRGRTVE